MTGAIEGIVVTDIKGIIENVNPSFTKIFGYEKEEVLGKTLQILRSDKHDTSFYQKMWESIEKCGYWEGEIWNKNKNGRLNRKFLTISQVKNSAGEIRYYVGRFYDPT